MADANPFAQYLQPEPKAAKTAGGNPFAAYLQPDDEDAPKNPPQIGNKGKAKPAGQIEAGNIDLANRPTHKNPDGSISTVRSMSFADKEGGPEILVPTIADNGDPLTDDQAIALYKKTGKHLGKFKTPDDADAYAQRLHEDQAKQYLPQEEAPEPAKPSLASRAGSALFNGLADYVGQPLLDLNQRAVNAVEHIGHTIAHPLSSGIGQAIAHPIDTLRGKGTGGAEAREILRGVNENIPFANRFVAAAGGPAAESEEDEAAAPGARDLGSFVGVPAANKVAGIAAKGVEAVAPVIGKAVKAIGERAQESQVNRAQEAGELKTSKTTRAGLRSDATRTAIRENPQIRKAMLSGNDAKLAKATEVMAKKAQGTLAPIYADSGDALNASAKAVENADARIAELEKGDPNQRAAAKKLKAIRDEFNANGGRGDTSAAALRQEQSAYQKNGYAKNINGDPDVSATILAHREMSKAVGDALVEHVTGMPYEEAKAAAAKNPNSLAARLFKANDQISAANKIDASIAGRADRPVPKHGWLKTAAEIKHSPLGWAASKIPETANGLTNTFVDQFARLGGDRPGFRLPEGAAAPSTPPPVRDQQARNAVLARSIASLTGAGVPKMTAIQVAQQVADGQPVPDDYRGLIAPATPDEPTEVGPQAVAGLGDEDNGPAEPPEPAEPEEPEEPEAPEPKTEDEQADEAYDRGEDLN